jgi:hypothetical protein
MNACEVCGHLKARTRGRLAARGLGGGRYLAPGAATPRGDGGLLPHCGLDSRPVPPHRPIYTFLCQRGSGAAGAANPAGGRQV